MNIRIPSNTAKLLRRLSKEVRKRKRDGLDIRDQQNFSDAIKSKKILAPNASEHEYWQMTNDLCSFGFGTYYVRGGFLLNYRGIDILLHPVRAKISSCRAEIIAICALIISVLTGWEELVTLLYSIVISLSPQ